MIASSNVFGAGDFFMSDTGGAKGGHCIAAVDEMPLCGILGFLGRLKAGKGGFQAVFGGVCAAV